MLPQAEHRNYTAYMLDAEAALGVSPLGGERRLRVDVDHAAVHAAQLLRQSGDNTQHQTQLRLSAARWPRHL